MTIPFTYRIGWSSLNLHYYGVRYRKDCHPKDLWETYFTSSKHVKRIREQFGDPDIIEIRKIFNDRYLAIDWEQKVLKKLHVKKNKKWLNIAIGKPSNLGNKHSEETKTKMRKPKPEGFGELISEKMKQYTRTEDHNKKIANSLKGRKLSKESIMKREQTRKENREAGLHKPRKKGFKRGPYKKKEKV
jgi:hypothetical protein